MNKKCPYCNSEKVENIVIRFDSGQEQAVNLCRECHKIFKKEEENV